METLTEEQGKQYLEKHFLSHDANPVLFVVLQEALKFPLPPPWQVVQSSGDGVYFFNPESKETAWELPYHPSLQELANNFEYVWKNGTNYDASADFREQEHDAEAHRRAQLALEAWSHHTAHEARIAGYEEVVLDDIPPAAQDVAAAASTSSTSGENIAAKDRYYYHKEDRNETTWDSPRTHENKFFLPKYDPLSRLLEEEYREYLREYDRYFRNPPSASDQDGEQGAAAAASRSSGGAGAATASASVSSASAGGGGGTTGGLLLKQQQHQLPVVGLAAANNGGGGVVPSSSAAVKDVPAPSGKDLQAALLGGGEGTPTSSSNAARDGHQGGGGGGATSSSSSHYLYSRTPTLDPEGGGATGGDGMITAESTSAALKQRPRSELRLEAERQLNEWDGGLALKKWMIPEQYAKYLHIEPGEETKLFTLIFLRPLMPPWRAKRDEKSRVFFQHVGSVPEEKKAWKHPLQSFFGELVPVVREGLQAEDLFERKSRFVAVMQKHAGRKSLKGMGTWIVDAEPQLHEEGAAAGAPIYVNREDTTQKRTDDPKVAACCQVYTKLWMLVTLWKGIFGEEQKCPLSDEECWSLAERLGNMVVQRLENGSSAAPSVPMTAKIQTPVDTPKGTSGDQEDGATAQLKKSFKPLPIDLGKAAGGRVPLGGSTSSGGDGGAGGSNAAESLYEEEEEKSELDEGEIEVTASSEEEGTAVAGAGTGGGIAAGGGLVRDDEVERLLAEHEARRRQDDEERLREYEEGLKAEFEERLQSERRASKVELEEQMRALLVLREEEAKAKQSEEVERLLAETAYSRDEELRTAMEEMKTKLQAEMQTMLEKLRENMEEEIHKMPEKRRDMELDWQREYSDFGWQLDLEKDAEFVDDQKKQLEAVASRSTQELAAESTKLLAEHQRLVDSSLEQKRLGLEREHSERTRHVEGQLVERKREIARELDLRKSALEEDLVRKTKEIELAVENRYLQNFERESARHTEDFLGRTQELQQQAFHEGRKRQGAMLDELEQDAKRRQEVFLAERALQQSRLQYESEALEEARKKAEAERKRLEEAKTEAERMGNVRQQADALRVETLERRLEEKLRGLERSIADNEREAQRREGELRTELETTRRSLSESMALLQSLPGAGAAYVGGAPSYGGGAVGGANQLHSSAGAFGRHSNSSLSGGPQMSSVGAQLYHNGGAAASAGAGDPLQHSVQTTQLHASPGHHRVSVASNAGGAPQAGGSAVFLPDPVMAPGARISGETAETVAHLQELATPPRRGDASSKSSQEESLRIQVKHMQSQMEAMEQKMRDQGGDPGPGYSMALDHDAAIGSTAGATGLPPQHHLQQQREPSMEELKSMFREIQAQQARQLAQLRADLVGGPGGAPAALPHHAGGLTTSGSARGGGENSPGGVGQKYLDRVILESVRDVVQDAMSEAFVADEYQRQRRKREAFAPNSRGPLGNYPPNNNSSLYHFPGGGGTSPVYYSEVDVGGGNKDHKPKQQQLYTQQDLARDMEQLDQSYAAFKEQSRNADLLAHAPPAAPERSVGPIMLDCFAFITGGILGSVLGVYKSEELKPTCDAIAVKGKEGVEMAKEKYQEFKENQQ
eukprot:g12868.t1